MKRFKYIRRAKIFIVFVIFNIMLLAGVNSYANDKIIIPKKTLEEYKIFSLGKCITGNYEQMGVDFDKLPYHDNTYGYIDIDVGLAFYSKRDNVLARYIKEKTGNFYKPSTDRGDLASANLIMYRCVDFYHSKELDVFLRKIIYQRLEAIQNGVPDDEK